MKRSTKYFWGCLLALAGVSLVWLFLLTCTPLGRVVEGLTDLEAVGYRWGLFPLFFVAVTAVSVGVVLWWSRRLELRLWGACAEWAIPKFNTVAALMIAGALLGHWLIVMGANALVTAEPMGFTWAEYTVAQYVYAGGTVIVGVLAIFVRVVKVMDLHKET